MLCSPESSPVLPCEDGARHLPNSLEAVRVPDMWSCEWQSPHESPKMGSLSVLSRKALGRESHWWLGR